MKFLIIFLPVTIQAKNYLSILYQTIKNILIFALNIDNYLFNLKYIHGITTPVNYLTFDLLFLKLTAAIITLPSLTIIPHSKNAKHGNLSNLFCCGNLGQIGRTADRTFGFV